MRQCDLPSGIEIRDIPSVRVEPELLEEVEKLLSEGESVSEFVEAAVRSAVRQRRNQAEFVARGLQSLARSKQTGRFVESDEVLRKLDDKLSAANIRKAAARS
ncbi:YlcI/YnfO family protein [Variovorax sp. J31P207]|uniref:YlcI/YnfO family protein n=1 Tax=Variovorax sp. J31P207 TaxID=3053510 RepID=UPI002576D472|nr:YlcI/YnfO family protein [Variovorax sp. J31P207]MDM0068359.1 YlcI/YnfO family protein [Variovorax sp. J31P207]